MYYVYVLRSKKDKRLYFGHTEHLRNRIAEHNTGKSKYTGHRGPWELVYFKKYSTRSLAMKKEKFFKSGKGREYLKKEIIIRGVAQSG